MQGDAEHDDGNLSVSCAQADLNDERRVSRRVPACLMPRGCQEQGQKGHVPCSKNVVAHWIVIQKGHAKERCWGHAHSILLVLSALLYDC